METITVSILNPKAAQLLQNLAELNLISIHIPSEKSFGALIEQMRSKVALAPSLDEITAEVEAVRAERYAQKSV
jgi:hypothetical protein